MAAADVRGGTTGLIARSGNIRLDMFERLVLADLVIADISIHNANVFYELRDPPALRDRPTILLRAPKTRCRSISKRIAIWSTRPMPRPPRSTR